MKTAPLFMSVPDALAILDGRKRAESLGRKPGVELSMYPAGRAREIYSIYGSPEALHSLASTACLATPSCFPVSSFAHVFDSDAFPEFHPEDLLEIERPDQARLGAFLAIGELFAYLNEDRPAPPSAIAAQYTRTLAYALSRSSVVWPKVDLAIIFSRWMDVRRSTGWPENELLNPQKLCRNLSVWLTRRNEFRWADEIFTLAWEETDTEFASKAAEVVSSSFGLALRPLPGSFDARFEWISVAVARLRASTQHSDEVEFALGLLLASFEPGELMHLNWLRRYLAQYPHAAIHYAGWSAALSSRRSERMDVFSGLGRRLIRDLLRPLRLNDPPTEDVSWIDIRASAELLDEVRLRANPRSLEISLIPGVVVGGILHKAADPAPKSPPTKQKSKRVEPVTPSQPTLFEASKPQMTEDPFIARVTQQIQELSRLVSEMQARERSPSKGKRK